ncbi:MAG: TrbG/VirB9 family P-type conjugative transfer protein [Vicinamibacteraceae bacterium]
MHHTTQSLLVLLTLMIAATSHAQVREVAYSERSLIPVHTKLRHTTIIVLPEDERILDYVPGDKDFWIVNGGADNMAYVKPAKAGGTTNLHLVAASGRIYSFDLKEGSDNLDHKIFVSVEGRRDTAGPRRYYSAEEYERLRARLADAEATATAAKADATKRISAFRADYPSRLRFDYDFPTDEEPFAVTQIWHDGEFTYIQSDARELPALYEERDGRPNLINYQVRQGTYVIPKVVEQGYLALGKRKLAFRLDDK